VNTIWSDLLRLFPRLRELPPDAYVVGGAVRDLTLGAAPADVDVACLDPLACARTFRRKVIRLGREEHLSAYRVIDGPHIYDFAALLDGSIDADLARRDFTVNAMAVSLGSGTLFDPHDGRGDLERRIVRMIDAINFDDDPLRMLKAAHGRPLRLWDRRRDDGRDPHARGANQRCGRRTDRLRIDSNLFGERIPPGRGAAARNRIRPSALRATVYQ